MSGENDTYLWISGLKFDCSYKLYCYKMSLRYLINHNIFFFWKDNARHNGQLWMITETLRGYIQPAFHQVTIMLQGKKCHWL